MAVNKPDKIDLTTVEGINNSLTTIYGQLDWWRNYLGFDGNVPRIYYHGGDRIEELIARLRGEIAYLAKNVSELAKEFEKIENKLNDLIDYIDDYIDGSVDAKTDAIAKELLEKVKADLELLFKDRFTLPLHGIPMLDQLVNHDYKLKPNDYMNIPFLSNVANLNSGNLQSVELDGYNMEWYVSQAKASADGTDEDTIVMRLNASGERISNMYLPKAGHGQATWLQSTGTKVYWYFVHNANIYRVQYQDNKTLTSDDWEPIMTHAPAPTNGVHGFDYTELHEGHNAFIWRHVDNVTERDGSTTDTQSEQYTIYAQNGEHNEDGTWTLSGEVASLNIEQYVTNNKDNSMQGMAVMTKADVTGIDDGTNIFYIFVSYGYWSTKSEILVLEYNQDNNEITYKTIIQNMNKLIVRPNEKQIFELEGLTHVRYNTGSGTAAGLIFTNAGGRSGSYMNRIFGFVNDRLLNLMSSFNREYASEQNRRYSDDETITHLWKYGVGSFTIRPNEWKVLQDKPNRWRGDVTMPGGYAYLDTIGKQNNDGDFIQVLTIPGYTYPVETYTRFINFNFTKFGSDFAPTNITEWQPANNYSSINKLPQNINETSMYQLTESLPYYVPANRKNFDYEGLDSSTAFTVTSISFGASGYPNEVSYYQKAIVYNTNDSGITYYDRYVRGVPYQYGSSLATKTSASEWIRHSNAPLYDELTNMPGWLKSSVRETDDAVFIELNGETASEVDVLDSITIGNIPASISKPAGQMSSYGIFHNISSATTAEANNIVMSIIVDSDGSVSINGNGKIPSGNQLRGSVVYAKDTR